MTAEIGFWGLMALPFAECLILVGIHSYLGLHVLRRKVIFVDLALAQVAALGTTVAFLFDIDPMSRGAYVFSLLFTIIAAAVFSLTRLRREKIPQEAVIGLVYALAASIGILVVSRAAHGAEHIKEVMTGALLWVRPSEVFAAGVVYTFVGIFHLVFREKFIAISEDPEAAYEQGINVRLWDFLFYLSFGLVITHSVRTAGVLLVFVFLIVPAILAMLLTDRWFHQLLIGWVFGTAVSIGGLALSYNADTATGPTVVSLYGLVLLAFALLLYLRANQQRFGIALTTVLGGILVVLGLGAGFYHLGTAMSDSPLWSGNGDQQSAAHGANADESHQKDTPEHSTARSPEVAFLAEFSALDMESKEERLQETNDPAFIEAILGHTQEADEESRLVLGKRLFLLSPAKGALWLVELLRSKTPVIRSDALDALTGSGEADSLGFDPWDEPSTDDNQNALRKWRRRCRRHGSTREAPDKALHRGPGSCTEGSMKKQEKRGPRKHQHRHQGRRHQRGRADRPRALPRPWGESWP